MLADAVRSFRRTLRSLAQRPGLHLAVVAILALALGASAAVFTVLDTVVLEPLDLDQPEDLVWVWSRHHDRGALFERTSEADLVDWRHDPGPFEALVGGHNRALTWSRGDDPLKLSVIVTSDDFFEVVRPRPMLGRLFEPGDGERRVVVLQHRFWRTHLGARQDVLGETLVLDGGAYEVIGVLPPSFELPRGGIDVFLTRRLVPEARRSFRSLWVLGRLKEGATVEQAQQHLDRQTAEIAGRFPDSHRGWDAHVVPLASHLVQGVQPALWTLFGAVTLVLLIAVVDTAHLLLLRSLERRHEVTVRRALGATRWHLVRQALGETLLLAGVAGVAGLGLAQLALPWLLERLPDRLPRHAEIALDGRTVVFGVAAVLVVSGLCVLLPRLRARHDLVSDLRSGSREVATGGRRLAALVVSEVALAMVLLAGAGLLHQSFQNLAQIDPGFETDDRAVVRVFTRPGSMTPVEREQFFDALETRLAEVPGVVQVGASTALPLSPIGLPITTAWQALGSDSAGRDDEPEADLRYATAGYFQTLGVPKIAGRFFDDDDRRGGAPVVVINETLARRAFPDGDAVGRQLRIAGAEPTVVGVVGDVRHDSLLHEARSEIYRPHRQASFFAGMTLVVETQGGTEALLPTLRRAVLEVDPEQPPHSVVTLASIFEQATARERFAAELLALFAVFAVVLAALGLHAVLAAAVAHKRREIGIRRALGASHRAIRTWVLRRALAWTAMGIVAGLVLAAVGGRWLEGLLVGVEPMDPAVLTLTALALLGIAVAAAWLPTRRALRIDASSALRQD